MACTEMRIMVSPWNRSWTNFAVADTVIFDTDVLIWAQKHDLRAMEYVGDVDEKAISIITYMELLHGSTSPTQLRMVKDFLSDAVFEVLPITEKIGHRALVYVEEHAVSRGLRALDAFIAATAVENNRLLVSANYKHFQGIPELKFRRFKPF